VQKAYLGCLQCISEEVVDLPEGYLFLVPAGYRISVHSTIALLIFSIITMGHVGASQTPQNRFQNHTATKN